MTTTGTTFDHTSPSPNTVTDPNILTETTTRVEARSVGSPAFNQVRLVTVTRNPLNRYTHPHIALIPIPVQSAVHTLGVELLSTTSPSICSVFFHPHGSFTINLPKSVFSKVNPNLIISARFEALQPDSFMIRLKKSLSDAGLTLQHSETSNSNSQTSHNWTTGLPDRFKKSSQYHFRVEPCDSP